MEIDGVRLLPLFGVGYPRDARLKEGFVFSHGAIKQKMLIKHPQSSSDENCGEGWCEQLTPNNQTADAPHIVKSYTSFVEYPLSITSLVETDREGRSLRSPLTCVMAEADLGPFADFGSPEFFFGRLVEVTGDELQYFRHAPGVEVLFRGQAYGFEALESTGSFKLVRKS